MARHDAMHVRLLRAAPEPARTGVRVCLVSPLAAGRRAVALRLPLAAPAVPAPRPGRLAALPRRRIVSPPGLESPFTGRTPARKRGARRRL